MWGQGYFQSGFHEKPGVMFMLCMRNRVPCLIQWERKNRAVVGCEYDFWPRKGSLRLHSTSLVSIQIFGKTGGVLSIGGGTSKALYWSTTVWYMMEPDYITTFSNFRRALIGTLNALSIQRRRKGSFVWNPRDNYSSIFNDKDYFNLLA